MVENGFFSSPINSAAVHARVAIRTSPDSLSLRDRFRSATGAMIAAKALRVLHASGEALLLREDRGLG